MTRLPAEIDDKLDDIDCAIFVGDTFHDKSNREELREYLESWTRELDKLEELEE